MWKRITNNNDEPYNTTGIIQRWPINGIDDEDGMGARLVPLARSSPCRCPVEHKNDNEQQPDQAHTQQWPTKANNGQQRPTMANKGIHDEDAVGATARWPSHSFSPIRLSMSCGTQHENSHDPYSTNNNGLDDGDAMEATARWPSHSFSPITLSMSC